MRVVLSTTVHVRTVLALAALTTLSLAGPSAAVASTRTPPHGTTFWIAKDLLDDHGPTPVEDLSRAAIVTFWRDGRTMCTSELNGWFRGSKQATVYVGERLNQNGPPIPTTVAVNRTSNRLHYSFVGEYRSPLMVRIGRGFVTQMQDGKGGKRFFRYSTKKYTCGTY